MEGVSTIVFLHAHPDDEASQTSGSMARASGEGHRVVVVYATNGDHGEAPADLAEGETVVSRRRAEAEASAQVTGTARVAWLGYADSGMTGWEQNGHGEALHGADLSYVVDTAIEQAFMDSLREGVPRMITTYDVEAAASRVVPSTRSWFEQIKPVLEYGVDDGTFAQLRSYLKKHRI